MIWVIVIFVVVLLIIVYNKRREFFGASNLFEVESSNVPIEKREFPIKDSFEEMGDTNNLVEQNKDIFPKDKYVDLLQKYIGDSVGKTDSRTKYKVFGDSIQSIFKGPDGIYFTINVYDISNFFVHKILVYIDNNSTVKVKELGSDQESSSEQLKPGLSSLAPNFYRILNKLHLMDPFLTSGNNS